MNKLIIDTDAGHDDVLAMLMLLQSKQFNVSAITTVAGNSTLENATRNTAYTLGLLAREDIPVFSGAAKPLKRKLIQAVVHGDSGLDGADTSGVSFELTGNAPEKICEIVRATPGQVTILTLGPLTNVAKAFTADAELASLVKEVVIMGGVVNAIGNKNRVAEFNIFVDPEAADIVFKADVKKTLIPFDSCLDIVLQLQDFESLKGTKLHAPVIAMMKPFIAGLKDEENIDGALLPDPLAAYYLLNPAAYNVEPMDGVVETKGEYTSGMTVFERRKHKPKKCNIQVATNIDKNAFTNDFFALLRQPIS